MESVARRENEGGKLCAILLNPPLRSAVGTPTYKNLRSALAVTNCSDLEISNLIDIPSNGLDHLRNIQIGRDDIERAQEAMDISLSRSTEILFAWGASVLRGNHRKALGEQVLWACERVELLGIEAVWMVAGAPRHPSRWRQYLGPQKGRVEGSTFEDRLAQVLLKHPLDTVMAPEIWRQEIPKKANIPRRLH